MKIPWRKYNPEPLKSKVVTLAKLHWKKLEKGELTSAQFHLQNGKCHDNAIQAVISGRAESVWMVMAGNDDHMVLHFINRDRDGLFFDETWGSGINDRYYHLIRKVDPDEFSKIGALLTNTKKRIVFLVGDAGDIAHYNENPDGVI